MNIQLRELKESDASGMLEWMTDPTITCFFRFDASKVSVDTCKAFICEANQQLNCKHYAIADENDEYLGTISLKDIDVKPGMAEYAISTRKSVHGTGAAALATEEILKIAFEELKLQSVYLNVLEENVRANLFYKKMGFQFQRKEENALEINGVKKHLNWYIISNYDRL